MHDAALAERPTRSRAVLVRLAVVYVAGRAFSLLALGTAWFVANTVGRADTVRVDQGFLAFLTTWDGGFYRGIVEHGYPTELPVDASGRVTQNAWAFMPVYPYLCRAVMSLGVPFAVAAVLVTVLAGFGALVACRAVMRRAFGLRAADRGAVLIAFGPLAFLFQVAYAEALFLLLMALGVLFVMRRQYWLFLLVCVVASFTRPGAVVLPAMLAVVLVQRLWQRDIRLRETVVVVVTGLVGAAAGLAWPVIVSAVTGSPSAYFDTEMAWWYAKDDAGFSPFRGLLVQTELYFGPAGDLVGVLAVLVALTVAVSVALRVRPELRAYGLTYVVYVLAVFLPQTSTLRLLMPLAPFAGHPLVTANRTRWIVIVVVSAVLQLGLCAVLWTRGVP